MASTIIALEGLAEIGAEELFQSGGWLRPFGTEPEELFKAGELQRLIGTACPAVSAAANTTFRRFPLGADEPECLLLTAPVPRAGLAILVHPTKETNELIGVWPFVSDGTQHDDVGIERITLSPDRLEAMVTGTLRGGLTLTWHDTMFAADRAFYAQGSVHSVILAGLVHDAAAGHTQPVVIPPDNAAWNEARKRTPDIANPDGSITIRLDELAAIIPASKEHPEFHEIHGPVTKVQPAAFEMFGRPVHLVTVIVARAAAGDTELTLHVTDAVLRDRPLPEVGTPFMALIRLVGRIWMPNTRD